MWSLWLLALPLLCHGEGDSGLDFTHNPSIWAYSQDPTYWLYNRDQAFQGYSHGSNNVGYSQNLPILGHSQERQLSYPVSNLHMPASSNVQRGYQEAVREVVLPPHYPPLVASQLVQNPGAGHQAHKLPAATLTQSNLVQAGAQLAVPAVSSHVGDHGTPLVATYVKQAQNLDHGLLHRSEASQVQRAHIYEAEPILTQQGHLNNHQLHHGDPIKVQQPTLGTAAGSLPRPALHHLPAVPGVSAGVYKAQAEVALPLPSQPGTQGSSQYHAQDVVGNVAYGYQNENSARHEVGLAGESVVGSYSYRDEAGLHTVSYIADSGGFRLL